MDMTPAESFERFSEGLKKASSRMRELGYAQKDRNWNKIAFQLDGIRKQGETAFRSKPLTEAEVMQMTEQRAKVIATPSGIIL